MKISHLTTQVFIFLFTSIAGVGCNGCLNKVSTHAEDIAANQPESDAARNKPKVGVVVYLSIATPCGEIVERENTAAVRVNYAFTGHEKDETLSMHDMGARFYSPATCRFTSRDPIEHAGSPYVYASNNVINRIDPDGMQDVASVKPPDKKKEDDKNKKEEDKAKLPGENSGQEEFRFSPSRFHQGAVKGFMTYMGAGDLYWATDDKLIKPFSPAPNNLSEQWGFQTGVTGTAAASMYISVVGAWESRPAIPKNSSNATTNRTIKLFRAGTTDEFAADGSILSRAARKGGESLVSQKLNEKPLSVIQYDHLTQETFDSPLVSTSGNFYVARRHQQSNSFMKNGDSYIAEINVPINQEGTLFIKAEYSNCKNTYLRLESEYQFVGKIPAEYIKIW